MDVPELVALVGRQRLGTLLRQRREECSMKLPAMARAAGITAGALDDIESGRKAASCETAAALLAVLQMTPDEFLPPRNTLQIGSGAGTPEQILRNYVESVRAWRGSKTQGPVSFRLEDLEVLVGLLGTDAGEIERRLMTIAGCSRREATATRRHFLQAVAAASATAAFLGAGVLGAPAAAAATTGPVQPAASRSTRTQVGVLQASTLRAATSRAAGISSVVVAVHWDAFAPSKNAIDADYVKSIKVQIDKFTGAGMRISLSPGLANPPGWVFDLDKNTRFVDQHGKVWKGGAGEDVPDAVFNKAVRAAQGTYLAQLGSALAGLPIDSVRVGGLCDGELRYPSAGLQNSYWAFNGAAQSQSPVPGWRPGDPGTDKASTFINWYVAGLTNYQNWLVHSTAQAFPSTKLFVLYPNWGVRPGQIEQAVAGRLGGRSPAEQNGTLQQGLDFASHVKSLPPGATVYTTTLATPSKGTGVVDQSPAEYLASLATLHHHPMAGENAGLQSQEALTNCIKRAESLQLTDMFWYNENNLYKPAAGAPSLAQLGAAATALAKGSPA